MGDLDLTVEVITHRFTPAGKEVLLGRYPNTKLEMDEDLRTQERSKFGGVEYVYRKAVMTDDPTGSMPHDLGLLVSERYGLHGKTTRVAAGVSGSTLRKIESPQPAVVRVSEHFTLQHIVGVCDGVSRLARDVPEAPVMPLVEPLIELWVRQQGPSAATNGATAGQQPRCSTDPGRGRAGRGDVLRATR